MENNNDIRERIQVLEAEIETRSDELSQLRQRLEPIKIRDYEFETIQGLSQRLSDLIHEEDGLVMVHNMGRTCPYCTTWADGFSDSYHRISSKVPFLVTSKESPEQQEKNRQERNWAFPMVSSQNNRFLEDLGFRKDGMVYPGLTYLTKNEAGEIFSHGLHVFGPGDEFGMLWHILDLVGKWDAKDF